MRREEVAQIVEAHRGWIRVVSEVGKGTVFTVEVPVNPKEITTVSSPRLARPDDRSQSDAPPP